MVETREKRGEFRYERLSNTNHIFIYPHPDIHADSALTMTGSDVTKYIDVPFPHRIVKLLLTHLDTNDAKTTDAMEVQLQVEVGRDSISKLAADYVFHETDINVAEFAEHFRDGFEYPARTYTLVLKADNTDKVIPVLHIQQLGGR